MACDGICVCNIKWSQYACLCFGTGTDNMSPAIGTPSQTPGTNPSTTTAPASAAMNPTFLSSLTGIATKAFSGIAAQATLSAQQKIAQTTKTTSISGAAGTSVFLIGAAILVIILFLIHGK